MRGTLDDQAHVQNRCLIIRAISLRHQELLVSCEKYNAVHNGSVIGIKIEMFSVSQLFSFKS